MTDPFTTPQSQQQFMREAKIGLLVVGLFIAFFSYVIYYRMEQYHHQVPDAVRRAPPSTLVDPHDVRRRMRESQQLAQPMPQGTITVSPPMPADADTTVVEPAAENRTAVPSISHGRDSDATPVTSPIFPAADVASRGMTTSAPDANSPSDIPSDPRSTDGLDSTSLVQPVEEIKSTVSSLRESLSIARQQLESSLSKGANAAEVPARPAANRQDSSVDNPIRIVQNEQSRPMARDVAQCPTLNRSEQDAFQASPLRSASDDGSDECESSAVGAFEGASPRLGLSPADKPASSSADKLDVSTDDDQFTPTEMGQASRGRTEPATDRFVQPASFAASPSADEFSPAFPSGGQDFAPPTNAGHQLAGSALNRESTSVESGEFSTSNFVPILSPGPKSADNADVNGPDPGVAKRDVPPADDQIIVANRDDTWWTLADRYYEDGRLFRALWAYNRQQGMPSDQDPAGQEIRVPSREILIVRHGNDCPKDLCREISVDLPGESGQLLADRSGLASTRDGTARSKVEVSSVSESVDPTGGQSVPDRYRTRSGDTLFDIARRQLGQASRYVELYQLNRERLPRNCSHLTSLPRGLELELPRR